MSYTPKPGDRVTSPLLVGEWVVRARPYVDHPDGYPHAKLIQGDAIAFVPPNTLTPVAPPCSVCGVRNEPTVAYVEGDPTCADCRSKRLPPEPPIGSVVWARGGYWVAAIGGTEHGWIGRLDHRPRCMRWDEIAADAVPVVPVTKVADWMYDHNDTGHAMRERFLAEFGDFT